MSRSNRKSNTSGKRHEEAMFIGNSEELKHFIYRKMNALKALQASTVVEKKEEKICALIYICQCVLTLPYFRRGKIRMMPELIDDIKAERNELKDLMEEIKLDMNLAKEKADEAFKLAGSYLANRFEESFESTEQVNAREAIDEYQALKAEYERAEEDAKTNLWLLGIIHRPIGFFSKAGEES